MKYISANMLEAMRIEDRVWRSTPKDYRSRIGGVRYVLELDKSTGSTCLVPLATCQKVIDRSKWSAP